MKEIQEKAWAKLNLSLDVTARREDGFHDLAMMMQTVSVCDELTVSLSGDGTVRLSSSSDFQDLRKLLPERSHSAERISARLPSERDL